MDELIYEKSKKLPTIKQEPQQLFDPKFVSTPAPWKKMIKKTETDIKRERTDVVEYRCVKCTEGVFTSDDREEMRSHVSKQHLDYFPFGCGHCPALGKQTWLTTENNLAVHTKLRHGPGVVIQVNEQPDELKERSLEKFLDQSKVDSALRPKNTPISTNEKPLEISLEANKPNESKRKLEYPAKRNSAKKSKLSISGDQRSLADCWGSKKPASPAVAVAPVKLQSNPSPESAKSEVCSMCDDVVTIRSVEEQKWHVFREHLEEEEALLPFKCQSCPYGSLAPVAVLLHSFKAHATYDFPRRIEVNMRAVEQLDKMLKKCFVI